VVAQRRRSVARSPVGSPSRAELVGFQGTNRRPIFRSAGASAMIFMDSFADDQLDLRRRVRRVVEFRNVNQPFDASSSSAMRRSWSCGRPCLRSCRDVAMREEVVPDVSGELLQPERQPLVLGVDVHFHRLDDVALLQDLRMRSACSRTCRDVNETVDFLFHLDKCAELCQVAHLA
jgi:hypothetical protein